MTSDGIKSLQQIRLEIPVRTYIYIMFLVAVKLLGGLAGENFRCIVGITHKYEN